jgi:hypothetical protein
MYIGGIFTDMSNKPIVIGISGVATAGKDLFATILINQLQASGKTVSRYALAAALKEECDSFCKEKLGFSAYTQKPEEKVIIRPLLVWYGDAKRKQTNGKYWVNIVHNKLLNDKSDYAIITDVRYAHYSEDEIQWAKNQWNGIIVHVTRSTKSKDGIVTIIPPANDHEAINDPKVKVLSDYQVNWEHVSKDPVNNPDLNEYVKDFISAKL